MAEVPVVLVQMNSPAIPTSIAWQPVVIMAVIAAVAVGGVLMLKATRRSLRFSLRTLFVFVALTALLLSWLVSNIKTVRDRIIMRQEMEASGVQFPGVFSGSVEQIQWADESFEISTVRQLLGDIEYPGLICFPHRPATAMDAAMAAYFPESDAYIYGPPAPGFQGE